MYLSSDFIIGFPNETDQDFQDTLNLAKDLDFDHSYSFIYSKRPGTPASDLPDNIDIATKKARLAAFQQVIIDSTWAKTQGMVGQIVRVLVEQHGDRNPEFLMGTADNTRTVLFKGDDALIGKLVMVKVTRAMSPHLVEGELVEVLG